MYAKAKKQKPLFPVTRPTLFLDTSTNYDYNFVWQGFLSLQCDMLIMNCVFWSIVHDITINIYSAGDRTSAQTHPKLPTKYQHLYHSHFL